MKHIVRFVLGLLLAYYVGGELLDDVLGTVYYFTYLGNFSIAVLLFLIVFKKVNERHIVFAVSVSLVIHVVYVFLLIGIEGVFDDFISYGFSNMLLHYITTYILLLDLFFFTKEKTYYYKDIWKYLIMPISYTIYVLIYGTIINDYPYFFLDIRQVGYGVVVYIIFIGIGYALLNAILMWLKKDRKYKI